MVIATDVPANVKLRITLIPEVFNAYSAQALESGQEIEEIIEQRLTQCVEQSTYSGRVLAVDPESRQLLETACGRNFQTGADLANYIAKSFELAIGKMRVPLRPELLRRLRTRSIRREFGEYLRDTIVRQLEHVVGLR